MPNRSTRRSEPVALRGVYEEPYRVNGHRVFFSVDSGGEQVALRTLASGESELALLDELWDDLDVTDPPTPASPSRRPFRLIRGGGG